MFCVAVEAVIALHFIAPYNGIRCRIPTLTEIASSKKYKSRGDHPLKLCEINIQIITQICSR